MTVNAASPSSWSMTFHVDGSLLERQLVLCNFVSWSCCGGGLEFQMDLHGPLLVGQDLFDRPS